MKKLLLFFLSFIIGFNSIKAQKFHTKNYDVNNGLLSNSINVLFKDSKGFLWIGTDAGLSQFNGNTFINYSPQNGLSGKNIQDICEDKNGKIWVSTLNSGLNQLDGNSIRIFNTHSGLINNKTSKLHYSKKLDLLFIGTENGLSTYNDSIGFESFINKQNESYYRFQVTEIIESNKEILIFTNGNGVFKYLPEIKDIIEIPNNYKLFNASVNSAYIGNFSKDTLVCYDRIYFKVVNNKKNISIDKFGPVSDYTQDRDSSTWIAVNHDSYWNEGGLYKYYNGKIVNYTSKLNLLTDNITCVEYDEITNSIWIGTKEYGMYLYPLTNFEYYTSDYFNLKSLDIKHLHFCNNTFYITTKNGVLIKKDSVLRNIRFEEFEIIFKNYAAKNFDKKYMYLNDMNGSFKKYQSQIDKGKYLYSNPYITIKNNTQKIIPDSDQFKPLKYNIIRNKQLREITGVYSDNKNNIWIGSNVGLFKLVGEEITFFDLEGIHFSNFLFDKNNILFASNWDELFILSKLDIKTPFSVYNNIDDNSPSNIISSQIKDNQAWFLTKDQGAYIYYKNEYYKTTDNSTLKDLNFNNICFDNFNNYVLGGTNGSIYIGTFENKQLVNRFVISTLDGISGSNIHWLKCSKNNFLVIGTNAGMNIINLKKLYYDGVLQIKSFNKSHGYIDYAGKSCVLDTSNILWIGSNKHLINVDLNKLNNSNELKTNFIIKKIEINNSNFDLSTSSLVDNWTKIPESSINLPYHKNTINLHFDVIEFLNPELLKFNHKLEGFDENWAETSNERRIQYQNLPTGKYRLRIKALNLNNTDSNHELSVNFIISKPFWKKWYSVTFSILLLAFIIWFIIQFRIRRIRKKANIKAEISERIMEFEMKALRAQMNPHFIFNAINSIQNYMLDNDIDEALNYLSDFAKLIRITLDNVSKKKINLEDELEYLNYYLKLEKMRFDKKFEVEIITPEELKYSKIQIPPMLVQPFIENSIKHGFVYKTENPKIIIRFEIVDDNILICSVEDNGIGRAKSKEINKTNKRHQSKGTFITQERIDLLNKTQIKKGYKIETIDLYNDFHLAIGTKVNIYVPI